jgi:hypothetical protein
LKVKTSFNQFAGSFTESWQFYVLRHSSPSINSTLSWGWADL